MYRHAGIDDSLPLQYSIFQNRLSISCAIPTASIYLQVCKCSNSCGVSRVSNFAPNAVDTVVMFTIASKTFFENTFCKKHILLIK